MVKVQKGIFSGTKRSDLKPRVETASGETTSSESTATEVTVVEPLASESVPTVLETRPSVSDRAIQLEANNRLERVRKEVLDARSHNDHKKASLARDMLNRGPKEVRSLVLESLQTFIDSLEPKHQVLMRKVRQSLTLEHPLESVNASLEAFFDIIELEVFGGYASPNHFTDYVIGHVLDLHSDLLKPLRKRMSHLAQHHETPWKRQEYAAVLQQLVRFDAVIEELAALQRGTGTPLEQAKAFVDGVMLRLRQVEPENHNALRHLNKLAVQSVQATSFEVKQALPDVLLEALENGAKGNGTMTQLLHACFESLPEFSSDLQVVLFEYLARHEVFQIYPNWPDYGIRKRMLEQMMALEPLPPLVTAMLRRTGSNPYYPDDMKALVKRVPPGVSAGEAWSDKVLSDLEVIAANERQVWDAFLKHVHTDKPKPSEAWEKHTRELIAKIPDFQPRVLEWLSLVGKERTFKLIEGNDKFDPWNANIVRGLAWSLALIEPSDDAARALARLVETSLKKVPGLGPRSPKLATAGTVALGRLNSSFAVGQLARLKARVTFKTTLKEIEKALEESARRAGISKADLEEIAVPTFGLEANGVRVEPLGEHRAELRIDGNDVTLEFFDANGKKLKSVPASIKKDFAEELKDLKTAQKDIVGMLGAIKARIEKLHLSKKAWTLRDWRERYLEHPLVGSIAKRLIWRINESSVFVHPKRGLEGVRGEKFKFADDAVVSLWHPIMVGSEEALEWRAYLEAAEIEQPWKQAHREIYVLTAAEERTRTYSNRFAAHILKQHQFAQLAAFRGWSNRLRLMVDDSYPPATLELPEWELRAEYWVEGIGDNYGTDTNETGAYLRVSTDQLRFYGIGAARNEAHATGGGYGPSYHFPLSSDPIPLERIPPVVLSEVMRDVDLFVGVASVGNDPTWQDGGPGGRYRDYWQSYSFGELNATAETRREILEKLIPRLKIRDRASVEGRFLKVLGDLRTYKIHLGSSNILMEPNDQYLCIVPSASMESSNISLPFEGDRTLAVILSKAFLLAEDQKITDPTITRQIKR